MSVSIWYSANGLALILGSLLSYGLAQIENTILDPYQWIFLMSGLIALIFAIPTMLILPSHPTTAKFLNNEQKYISLERIRLNNTGTQNTRKSANWLSAKDLLTWQTLTGARFASAYSTRSSGST